MGRKGSDREQDSKVTEERNGRNERKEGRNKVFDVDMFNVALMMLWNAPINSHRSRVWHGADWRLHYGEDDPHTWR
jgi:hypothetical protein